MLGHGTFLGVNRISMITIDTATGAIIGDQKPGQLANGIYIGLDADRYHEDDALGSSDIKRLRRGAFEYWWGSRLNPCRPEDDETEAQKVGTAYHKIILEGRQAFDALYLRRPDDERGASAADKSAITKAANAAAAKLGKESL